jgi:DNA-binding NarL/FixJ family response regulator
MHTRVIVVAQSPVLRIGIQEVVERTGAFTVIGSAENGLEAINVVMIHQPDVVIIQDALRGVAGVIVARAVRESAPCAGIVVLTEQCSDLRLVAAVTHGVDALLPADVDGAELVTTIQRVLAGDKPLAELVLSRPELAARIFDEVRAPGLLSAGSRAKRQPLLTGREIAILDGVVRGLSNREIAEQLFVVEQTVKNQMTVVLRKLSATDRTEAVVSAVKTGMVDLIAQLPAPVDASAFPAA